MIYWVQYYDFVYIYFAYIIHILFQQSPIKKVDSKRIKTGTAGQSIRGVSPLAYFTAYITHKSAFLSTEAACEQH